MKVRNTYIFYQSITSLCREPEYNIGATMISSPMENSSTTEWHCGSSESNIHNGRIIGRPKFKDTLANFFSFGVT